MTDPTRQFIERLSKPNLSAVACLIGSGAAVTLLVIRLVTGT